MGSARRSDWEEKTVINDLPAAEFVESVEKERASLRPIGGDELAGLFDEDEHDAVTRMRDEVSPVSASGQRTIPPAWTSQSISIVRIAEKAEPAPARGMSRGQWVLLGAAAFVGVATAVVATVLALIGR